jgi:hypothetical protein
VPYGRIPSNEPRSEDLRQIVQSLKTGATEVAEVPAPALRPGHLLIRTRASLVSAGTERILVAVGKAIPDGRSCPWLANTGCAL